MDFSALLAELRDVAEKYRGKDAEPSISTVVYVDMFTKILKRVESSMDDYEDQITVLWVTLNQLASIYKELSNGDPRNQLCRFIFALCAKTVLNIQWPQLDEDSEIKKNFCTTVENVHKVLSEQGFARFQLILDLMDTHWTHPILSQIMSAEDDVEGGEEYIRQEDPEILKLRVEIMMKENCEEFALNLCSWSLKHPALATDLKIKEWQIVMLYRQNEYGKMQEVCESIVCHNGIKVMSHLAKMPSNQELCIRLAQIFLIQNWIQSDRNCCTQELLKLWIHHQYLADKDEERFLESIWAVAKVSSTTEQIGVLIDGVRKECGEMFIQLYTELCKFALNIDKGNVEQEMEKGNIEEVEIRQMSISKTCIRLAFLVKDYDFHIARVCGLTAFSLNPIPDSLNLVNKLYWTIKNTSAASGRSKLNPATLYEIERLLDLMRPATLKADMNWKQIIPLCKKYKSDREKTLADAGGVYVPVVRDSSEIAVKVENIKLEDTGQSASDTQKEEWNKFVSDNKPCSKLSSHHELQTEKQTQQSKMSVGTPTSKPEVKVPPASEKVVCQKPVTTELEKTLGLQFPSNAFNDLKDGPELSKKDLGKTIHDLKQSLCLEPQFREQFSNQFTNVSSNVKKNDASNTVKTEGSSYLGQLKSDESVSLLHPPNTETSNIESQVSGGVSSQKPPSAHLYQRQQSTPQPDAFGGTPPAAHTHNASNLYPRFPVNQPVNSRRPFSPPVTQPSKNQQSPPYGNPIPGHLQSASDSIHGDIHNKMLQRQHSSPSTSYIAHQQQVAPSVRTYASRMPTVLQCAVRSSQTGNSPQECATIAQQKAKIHEMQRAEREAQTSKSLLNSHNIPSSNQISNILNLHLKNKNSSQSPVSQTSGLLSKEMLQELNKPYQGDSIEKPHPNKPKRKYTKKTSYGDTINVTTDIQQKNVNKGEQPSSRAIQMATELDKNQPQSRTIKRQKYYVATSNVMDKLKTDRTGTINLKDTKGLSVTPMFSMVVPKVLTSPKNQQALVNTVTNFVQKAGTNTQFSQPNVQNWNKNSGILTTVANSSLTQQETVANASMQQKLISPTFPDHVIDFLQNPNQKEVVNNTSLPSGVSGRFNILQKTPVSESNAPSFFTQQTSNSQSNLSSSVNAGMTCVQNEASQIGGSYASEPYSSMQRPLLPKVNVQSKAYSSNTFSHPASVSSLSSIQPTTSQPNLSDQLFNQIASAFAHVAQENISSMDMVGNISGVTNTDFSSIPQSVGAQGVQMLNIQQTPVVVTNQTSLAQAQMMNNQYLMSQPTVDQTIVCPQQHINNSQQVVVNQQHVSHTVNQINMSMQTTGIQSLYQTQNASRRQVGNVQNVQLAPSQQIVNVNSPVNVQQSLVNTSTGNQMGMQYPTKSLDQLSTCRHVSGRPLTGQSSASSKVPKQKSTATQELSPAVLQKILSDLMKGGALKQNPNTGQLEVPDFAARSQNISANLGCDYPESVRKSVLEATKRILQKRHANKPSSRSHSSADALQPQIQTTNAPQDNFQANSINPIATNVQIPNVSILTSTSSSFSRTPATNSDVNQRFGPTSTSVKQNIPQMINIPSTLPELPDLGSKEFAIDSILNPDNQQDVGVSPVTDSHTHVDPALCNSGTSVNYIAPAAATVQTRSLPHASSLFHRGHETEEPAQMQESKKMSSIEALLTGCEPPKSLKMSSTPTPTIQTIKQSTYLNANRLAKEREGRESNNLQDQEAVVELTGGSKHVEISHAVSGSGAIGPMQNKTSDSQLSEISVKEKRNSQKVSPLKSCLICRSTFPTLDLLKEHAKNRCSTKNEFKNLKDFECTQYYFCTKCNFSNKKADIVSKHVELCALTIQAVRHTKAELGVVYQCEMCMAKFVEKESAYKHISKLCPKIKSVIATKDVAHNVVKSDNDALPSSIPGPAIAVQDSLDISDNTEVDHSLDSANVIHHKASADNYFPASSGEQWMKDSAETKDSKHIVQKPNEISTTDTSEEMQEKSSKKFAREECVNMHVNVDVNLNKCDNIPIKKKQNALNNESYVLNKIECSKETITIDKGQSRQEMEKSNGNIALTEKMTSAGPETVSVAGVSKSNSDCNEQSTCKKERLKSTSKAKKMLASSVSSSNLDKAEHKKTGEIKKQTMSKKLMNKKSTELSGTDHTNVTIPSLHKDQSSVETESQCEKMTNDMCLEVEKKHKKEEDFVGVKQIDKDNELYKLYDLHLAKQVRERIEHEKVERFRHEKKAERIRNEKESEHIRKEKLAEDIRREKEAEITSKRIYKDKGESVPMQKKEHEDIHNRKAKHVSMEKEFKQMDNESVFVKFLHKEKDTKHIQKQKEPIHKRKEGKPICKENNSEIINKGSIKTSMKNTRIVKPVQKTSHTKIDLTKTLIKGSKKHHPERKHTKSQSYIKQTLNKIALSRKAQPIIKGNTVSVSKKMFPSDNGARADRTRFVKHPRRHLRSTIFARRSPQSTRNKKLRSLRSASLIKKRIFLIDEMEPIEASSHQLCKICGDKTFSRGLARHYCHVHHLGFLTKGDYFKCEFCKFRCPSLSTIKLHTLRHADSIIQQVNKQSTPKCRKSLLEANTQMPSAMGPVTSDESPRSAKIRKHLKAAASRSKCADRLKKIAMQASIENDTLTDASTDESDMETCEVTADNTVRQTRQRKRLKSPSASSSDFSTASNAKAYITTRSRSSSISSRSSVNTLSSVILQERERRKPHDMKQKSTREKACNSKSIRSTVNRNCYSPVSDASSEQSYSFMRKGSRPQSTEISKTLIRRKMDMSTDSDSSDNEVQTKMLTRSKQRKNANDPQSMSRSISLDISTDSDLSDIEVPTRMLTRSKQTKNTDESKSMSPSRSYIKDSEPSNNEMFDKNIKKMTKNISTASFVGSVKDRTSLKREASASSDDIERHDTQKNKKKRKLSVTSCTKDDGTVYEEEKANRVDLSSKLQQSPIAKRTRHSTERISVLAQPYAKLNLSSDVDTSENEAKDLHQTNDVEKTLKRLYQIVPPKSSICEESESVALPHTSNKTETPELPTVSSKQTNSEIPNKSNIYLSEDIQDKVNFIKNADKSAAQSKLSHRRLSRRSAKQFYEELESDSETENECVKKRAVKKENSDPDFKLEPDMSHEQKVKPTEHNLKSCATSGDSELQKTSLAVMLHPDDDDEFAALKALPNAIEHPLESTVLLGPDEEFHEFCSNSNEMSTDSENNIYSSKEVAMESTVLFNPADEFSDIQLSLDARKLSSEADTGKSKAEVKQLLSTERLENTVLLSPDEEFADLCLPDQQNVECVHSVTKCRKDKSENNIGLSVIDVTIDDEETICRRSETKANPSTTTRCLESSVLLSPEDEFSDLSLPDKVIVCENTRLDLKKEKVDESVHAPADDGKYKSVGEGFKTGECDEVAPVNYTSVESELSQKNVTPKSCGRYDSEYSKFAETTYKKGDFCKSTDTETNEPDIDSVKKTVHMKKNTNVTQTNSTMHQVIVANGERTGGFMNEFQSFFNQSKARDYCQKVNKSAGGNKRSKQTVNKKDSQKVEDAVALGSKVSQNDTKVGAKPQFIPVCKLPDCRVVLHRLKSTETPVKLGNIYNQKTENAEIDVIVIDSDSDDGTVDHPFELLLDDPATPEHVDIRSLAGQGDKLQHDSNTCSTNINEQSLENTCVDLDMTDKDTAGTTVYNFEETNKLSDAETEVENSSRATVDIMSEEMQTDTAVKDGSCSDSMSVLESDHQTVEFCEEKSAMPDSKFEMDIIKHVLEDIVAHVEENTKKQFNELEICDDITVLDTACTITGTCMPHIEILRDSLCTPESVCVESMEQLDKPSSNSWETRENEQSVGNVDLEVTDENNSLEEPNVTMFNIAMVQSGEKQNTYDTNDKSCNRANEGVDMMVVEQNDPPVEYTEEKCVTNNFQLEIEVIRHILDGIVDQAATSTDNKSDELENKVVTGIIPEADVTLHELDLPEVGEHEYKKADIEKSCLPISNEIIEGTLKDCDHIQNLIDTDETFEDKDNLPSEINIQNNCVNDSEDSELRRDENNTMHTHDVSLDQGEAILNKKSDLLDEDDLNICCTVDVVVRNVSVPVSSDISERKEENAESEEGFSCCAMDNILTKSYETVISNKTSNDAGNLEPYPLLMADQLKGKAMSPMPTTNDDATNTEDISCRMTNINRKEDIQNITTKNTENMSELGDTWNEININSTITLEASKGEINDEHNAVQLKENIEMCTHEEIEVARSEDMADYVDFRDTSLQLTDTVANDDVNVDTSRSVVNDICFASQTNLTKRFDSVRGHSVELCITCESPMLGNGLQDNDSSNDVQPLSEMENYDQNESIHSDICSNLHGSPKTFVEDLNLEINDITEYVAATLINTSGDRMEEIISVELQVVSTDNENACELDQTNNATEINNTPEDNCKITQEIAAVELCTPGDHNIVSVSAEIVEPSMDNMNYTDICETKSVIEMDTSLGDSIKHNPFTLSTSNVTEEQSHTSNSSLNEDNIPSNLNVSNELSNPSVADSVVIHEPGQATAAIAVEHSVIIGSACTSTDMASNDDITIINLAGYTEEICDSIIDRKCNSDQTTNTATRKQVRDASKMADINNGLHIAEIEITGEYEEPPDSTEMLNQLVNLSKGNKTCSDAKSEVLEIDHIHEQACRYVSTDSGATENTLLTSIEGTDVHMVREDISPVTEESPVSTIMDVDAINQSVNLLECTVSTENNINSVINTPDQCQMYENVKVGESSNLTAFGDSVDNEVQICHSEDATEKPNILDRKHKIKSENEDEADVLDNVSESTNLANSCSADCGMVSFNQAMHLDALDIDKSEARQDATIVGELEYSSMEADTVCSSTEIDSVRIVNQIDVDEAIDKEIIDQDIVDQYINITGESQSEKLDDFLQREFVEVVESSNLTAIGDSVDNEVQIRQSEDVTEKPNILDRKHKIKSENEDEADVLDNVFESTNVANICSADCGMVSFNQAMNLDAIYIDKSEARQDATIVGELEYSSMEADTVCSSTDIDSVRIVNQIEVDEAINKEIIDQDIEFDYHQYTEANTSGSSGTEIDSDEVVITKQIELDEHIEAVCKEKLGQNLESDDQYTETNKSASSGTEIDSDEVVITKQIELDEHTEAVCKEKLGQNLESDDQCTETNKSASSGTEVDSDEVVITKQIELDEHIEPVCKEKLGHNLESDDQCTETNKSASSGTDIDSDEVVITKQIELDEHTEAVCKEKLGQNLESDDQYTETNKSASSGTEVDSDEVVITKQIELDEHIEPVCKEKLGQNLESDDQCTETNKSASSGTEIDSDEVVITKQIELDEYTEAVCKEKLGQNLESDDQYTETNKSASSGTEIDSDEVVITKQIELDEHTEAVCKEKLGQNLESDDQYTETNKSASSGTEVDSDEVVITKQIELDEHIEAVCKEKLGQNLESDDQYTETNKSATSGTDIDSDEVVITKQIELDEHIEAVCKEKLGQNLESNDQCAETNKSASIGTEIDSDDADITNQIELDEHIERVGKEKPGQNFESDDRSIEVKKSATDASKNKIVDRGLQVVDNENAVEFEPRCCTKLTKQHGQLAYYLEVNSKCTDDTSEVLEIDKQITEECDFSQVTDKLVSTIEIPVSAVVIPIDYTSTSDSYISTHLETETVAPLLSQGNRSSVNESVTPSIKTLECTPFTDKNGVHAVMAISTSCQVDEDKEKISNPLTEYRDVSAFTTVEKPLVSLSTAPAHLLESVSEQSSMIVRTCQINCSDTEVSKKVTFDNRSEGENSREKIMQDDSDTYEIVGQTFEGLSESKSEEKLCDVLHNLSEVDESANLTTFDTSVIEGDSVQMSGGEIKTEILVTNLSTELGKKAMTDVVNTGLSVCGIVNVGTIEEIVSEEHLQQTYEQLDTPSSHEGSYEGSCIVDYTGVGEIVSNELKPQTCDVSESCEAQDNDNELYRCQNEHFDTGLSLDGKSGFDIADDVDKTEVNTIQDSEYIAIPLFKGDIKYDGILAENETNNLSLELQELPAIGATGIEPLKFNNDASPMPMQILDKTIVSNAISELALTSNTPNTDVQNFGVVVSDSKDIMLGLPNLQQESALNVSILKSCESGNDLRTEESKSETNISVDSANRVEVTIDIGENQGNVTLQPLECHVEREEDAKSDSSDEVLLISLSPLPGTEIVSTDTEPPMFVDNNRQTIPSTVSCNCSSSPLQLSECETDSLPVQKLEHLAKECKSRMDVLATQKSVCTSVPLANSRESPMLSNLSENKFPCDAVKIKPIVCHIPQTSPTTDPSVKAVKGTGHVNVSSSGHKKSMQKNLTGLPKKLGTKKSATFVKSSLHEDMTKVISPSKNYCEEVKKLVSKSKVKKMKNTQSQVPTSSTCGKSNGRKSITTLISPDKTCTSPMQKVPPQTATTSGTYKQPMAVTRKQKVRVQSVVKTVSTGGAHDIHTESSSNGKSSFRKTSMPCISRTTKLYSEAKECEMCPTRQSDALTTNDGVHTDKVACNQEDGSKYKVIDKEEIKSDATEEINRDEQIVNEEVDFKLRTENVKKVLKKSRRKPYQSDFDICEDDTESVLSSTSTNSSNSLESKHQRLQDFVNETPLPIDARNISPLFMFAHTNASPEKVSISRMATRLAQYSKYESPSLAQKILAGDIVRKYSRRMSTEPIKTVITSPVRPIRDDHLLPEQVLLSRIQYPDIETSTEKPGAKGAEDCLEILATSSDHSTGGPDIPVEKDDKEMVMKFHLLRESHKDEKPFSWDEAEIELGPAHSPKNQQTHRNEPFSWDETELGPSSSPEKQTPTNVTKIQRRTRSSSPNKNTTPAKEVKNTDVRTNTRQNKRKCSGDHSSCAESKIQLTSRKKVDKTSIERPKRQRTLSGETLNTGNRNRSKSIEKSETPSVAPRFKRKRSASSDKIEVSKPKHVKTDISYLSKPVTTKDGVFSRTDETMNCCCSAGDLTNACEKCLDAAQRLKVEKNEQSKSRVRRVIHGGKVFEIEKGYIKETDIKSEPVESASMSGLTVPVKSSTPPPLVESRVKTRLSAALKDTVNREVKQKVQSPRQSNTTREQQYREPHVKSASVQAVGSLNEYICATLNEIRKQRTSGSKTGAKWNMSRKPDIKTSKYPYSFKKS